MSFGSSMAVPHPLILPRLRVVASKTALSTVNVNLKKAFVNSVDGGEFVWKSGDYSAEVTADTQKGVYVASASAASTSGAWVRSDYKNGVVHAWWFGFSESESAANNSTYFDAALSFAASTAGGVFYSTAGGAVVKCHGGVFSFNNEHVVPEFVDVKGAGKGKTVFKCASAGASIRYGTKAGAFGAAQRGGESGGFTVDGNDTANLGLLIGFVVERDFKDIDVINCKGSSNGDGIVIQAAQNCNFVGVNAQHNGGTSGDGCNIVLDYGAGNNRFYGSEVNRPGEYNIKFIQSGTSPTGAFSVPTGNRFYGAMIERWEDQDDTGTVTALGSIYHGAGRTNYFDNVDLSLTGLPSALPMVVMRKDGAGASTLLTFNNPKFHGTASQSVALDIDGAVNCRLVGVSFFENHGTVFKVGDASAVHIIGELVDSSGGTFFANQSGGSATQDQVIFFEGADIVHKLARGSAGNDALSVSVSGESFTRMILRPNGIALGPGSSAVDVSLSRDSAAGVASLKTDTALFELGAAGIVVVTGAPTIGVPDGWIAFRTDGGAGTTIYHRTGGAWVARA